MSEKKTIGLVGAVLFVLLAVVPVAAAAGEVLEGTCEGHCAEIRADIAVAVQPDLSGGVTAQGLVWSHSLKRCVPGPGTCGGVAV